MRIRALVAAAAVALIVPAVPAFATETPSTEPTQNAPAEPAEEESAVAETATEDPTDPATDPAADPALEDPALDDPEPGQSEATLTLTQGTYKAGSTITIGVEVSNHTALVAPYVFVWSLGSETTTTDADGNLPITLDETGRGTVTVTVPSGLASGTYRIGGFIAGEQSGAPFAENPVVGTIDSVNPGVRLSRSLTTFYPVRDGYRDSVKLGLNLGETASYTASVTTSGGKLVKTLGSSSSFKGAKSYSWNGYNNAGTRVSGTYVFKVVAKDVVGNSTTAKVSVAASAKKLIWKSYYKQVTAKDALNYKHVGSCSSLKAPARSGWAESRGLHSNVRCKASATSSKATVYTENATCLPRSVDGNYRNLSLKHYGGRPKGYSKNVYLVTTVLRPSDWAARQRHQFGNSVKWKTMASVSSPNSLIQSRLSSKHCPALWWTAGLNSSSRYDVWKYSVGLQYRVLG